ncbi:putative Mg(2+) transport ATPase [Aeoliella mucimassa]|uniref:Putative Mg(2+) transport ATPase n=1 Tax=Aeoliella mucimassa TaxID=2527972 RepID=A0A518AVU0_9BACT|nr:putative Mg(2+) transport ATPase [Aeoliella mucimassa]
MNGNPMNFDMLLLGDNLLRLSMAALAGGVLGLERELSGHWAGLRTHMVVAIGASMFVSLGLYIATSGSQQTVDPNAAARVVQ